MVVTSQRLRFALFGCAALLAASCRETSGSSSSSGSITSSTPTSSATATNSSSDTPVPPSTSSSSSDPEREKGSQEILTLARKNSLEADKVARRYVEEAKTAHGTNSAAYAQAQFDRANMLHTVGAREAAVAPYEACMAVHGEPADTAAIDKLRLTASMSYGRLLSELGRHERAVAVLRAALGERLKLYGAKHPGYGYGATSLGEELAKSGAATEGARYAREGFAALSSEHEHPILPLALAVVIVTDVLAKTRDRDTPPPDLSGWSQARRDEALQESLEIASWLPLADEQKVVEGLVAPVRAQKAEGSPVGSRVFDQLAQVYTAQGKHALAADTWLAVARDLDAAHRAEDAALARMLAAGAHERGGDAAKARALYDEIMAKRADLASSALARILMTYGSFLTDRTPPAPGGLAKLEEAVKIARTTGPTGRPMLVSALSMYGVRLQHAGKNAEAIAPLTEAVEKGDPISADSLVARAHLVSATKKEKCACDKSMGAVTASGVAELFRQIPNGPVGTVRERLEGGKSVGLDVSFSRPATPDEAAVIEVLRAQAQDRLFSPRAHHYDPPLKK